MGGIELLLARSLGIVMFLLGLSTFLNRKHFDRLAGDLAESPALITLIGIISMLLGAVLIALHNVWTLDWMILLTLVAWTLFLRGVVHTIFPGMVVALCRASKGSRRIQVAGGLCVLVGLFLIYEGFFSGLTAAASHAWKP